MARADVVVIGGGPAGLQAALVLSRARKRVVVFDSPGAARNAASRGVHNFLGLDGMLPAAIRERAWQQIDAYGHAEHVAGTVERVVRAGEGFEVHAGDVAVRARRVIAAFGYADRHPALEGFEACWGRTIIPCPFCDGFENADRVWGVVAETQLQLDVFPTLALSWASRVEAFVGDGPTLDPARERELRALGIGVHRGSVAALHLSGGELAAVDLTGGGRVAVGTLFWRPPSEPVALLLDMVERLGLELDDAGGVVVDASQRTNVPGLYVAGDLQGWSGAIRAASQGCEAAMHIVKTWT